MANSFRPENYPFETNLTQQSLNQIEFLRTVDAIPGLKSGDFLKYALYRYESFWLPLAFDHQTECLSAPIDIEWIWHCHMLSPQLYSKDCQAIVGSVIDHTIRNPDEYKMAVQTSEELWNRKYPGESFHVDLNKLQLPDELADFKSAILYDVVSAALRQNVFYYQVSLPHYRDPTYLELCLARYKRFIYVKQKLPDEFIVPCYDIDIMWHSHQLNPAAYERDMMKYIGNLFNHDDSVNERHEGSKLNSCHANTIRHWRNFLNEKYFQYGAMYRGQPPDGVLYRMTGTDALPMSTRATNVTLETCKLDLQSVHRGKICLKVIAGADTRDFRKIASAKTPFTPSVSFDVSKPFQFLTEETNKLKVSVCELYAPPLCPFCPTKTPIGEGFVEMCERIEDHSADSDGTIDVNLKLGDENNILHVKGTFSKPVRGNTLLNLDRGQYEVVLIPETISVLWGPVALERLPPGVDNTCYVSTHRLQNHRGIVELTARVIHSPQVLQSVIQIFYHDKMAAIGHLIASDQLPLPSQVKSKAIPTLNPRQGERAVLIKNRGGDWGIVTGRWTGMRKGIPGTPGTSGTDTTTGIRGTRGIQGRPGSLSIKFYKMSTGQMSTLDLRYQPDSCLLSLESIKIDLKKGTIVVDSNATEVAENIAFGFAVSLLHVLCVPRPKTWMPGDLINISSGKAFSRVPSDDLAFVRACGLHIDTPSNHYIRRRYGISSCAMCGGGDGSGDGAMVCDFSRDVDGLDGAGDGCNDLGGFGGDGELDGTGFGGCGGCGSCGGCGGGGGGFQYSADGGGCSGCCSG